MLLGQRIEHVTLRWVKHPLCTFRTNENIAKKELDPTVLLVDDDRDCGNRRRLPDKRRPNLS